MSARHALAGCCGVIRESVPLNHPLRLTEDSELWQACRGVTFNRRQIGIASASAACVVVLLLSGNAGETVCDGGWRPYAAKC